VLNPLTPAEYRDIVRRAIDEDVRGGDITTNATVSDRQQARGVLLVKAPCVLAGLDVAMDAFHQLDADVRVENRRRDGDRCAPGDEIAVVSGRARALLVGERTALNLL